MWSPHEPAGSPPSCAPSSPPTGCGRSTRATWPRPWPTPTGWSTRPRWGWSRWRACRCRKTCCGQRCGSRMSSTGRWRLNYWPAPAARAGFDGIEIFEGDLITSRLSPADVRLRAADLGLRILLYQPFRDYEAVPDDLLGRSLRRAECKFELMAALGAPMLLVCSNVSPAALDDDARATDQLHRLAERADGHGLCIAYEALAWGRHVNSFARAWKLVAAADHPRLGICL